MAGAIFYGHLNPDQRNWPLLPSGELQKMTASEFVYSDSSHSFRLLMRAVYANVNPPHAFPFSGGLLDQPREFLDAIQCFANGKSLYANQARNTNELLKRLGAK